MQFHFPDEFSECFFQQAATNVRRQAQNHSLEADQYSLSRLLALFTLVLRHCYIHIEAAKTEFSRKVVASLSPACSYLCPQESLEKGQQANRN
jgi:hypothetical protein